MDGASRFDPPEAVVAPAFKELLERLRRAQLAAPPNTDLLRDERKLFEHGVAKRRRVLEHTLLLVLGQWVVYRQAVSRLSSRPLRLLVATSSVVGTAAYVRQRAALVSHDLFEHIVTAGGESALGNEAVCVLAELEGVNGPYFRQVVRRRRDVGGTFDAVVAEVEQAAEAALVGGAPDGEGRGTLRLEPRLFTAEVEAATRHAAAARGPPHAAGRPGAGGRQGTGTGSGAAGRGQGEVARERSAIRMAQGRGLWDAEGGGTDVEGVRVRISPTAALPAREDAPPDVEWGKAFDFSKGAARAREDEGGWHADSDGDDAGGGAMTPSQRRAAERRKKRLEARTRASLDRVDGRHNG